MIGKLFAKYQLCAIRTADNTDGKSRKSIVSEKSPPFRPARCLAFSCIFSKRAFSFRLIPSQSAFRNTNTLR